MGQNHATQAGSPAGDASVQQLRYERADVTSNTYHDWLLDHVFLVVPAQAYVAQMLGTLREFPPRQEPASFNISQVMEKLRAGIGSS